MKNTYSLAGEWKAKLDPEQIGERQGWQRKLTDVVMVSLPGTTVQNKMGNPVRIAAGLTKEAVKSLREEYKYVGAVWYERTFTMADIPNGREVLLSLERVMFQSKVWIDGQEIGSRDSLSTPHRYVVTNSIKANTEHTLTVRIDNADIQNIGPYPSAYTDETQTIWNGIVGAMELQIVPTVQMTNVHFIVGDEQKQIEIVMNLQSLRAKKEWYTIRIALTHTDSKQQDMEQPVSMEQTVCTEQTGHMEQHVCTEQIIHIEQTICIDAQEKQFDFELAEEYGNALHLWDFFEPVLYEVQISLYTTDGNVMEFPPIRTGIRKINQENGKITINGVPRFLRGNIDCCVYPKTGYPPMERGEWKKVMGTTKEYGFNHIRFHSWCAPEVAFQVADELGLYLQIEGPVWMDDWTGYTVGCYPEHASYLPAEATRIIKEYGHHPSFCIFSNGNELHGDFQLLEQIIYTVKMQNSNILYTLSTNWDRAVTQEDDLYIAQAVDSIGIRGQYNLDQLVEGTTLNFDEGIVKRSIPVMSHEVGQYVVYPNVNEIAKYTGVLKPTNLQAIKEDLEEKNLLQYVPDFMEASGKLSYHLYKAEMEAALRTRNMAGIQFLGLQDFPGQSTATIGLLDCFFDSKGIISSSDYRKFCNDVALLAQYKKNCYERKEEVTLDFYVANYSSKPLDRATIDVEVKFLKTNTRILHSIEAATVPIGVHLVGSYTIPDTKKLAGRNPICIQAGIEGLTERNNWTIWVYEKLEKKRTFTNCYTKWCRELEEKLEQGQKVILFPDTSQLKNIGPSTYFPVFWSPVHFESKDPCGMLIQNSHPLFDTYIPTEGYATVEWKNLLEHAVSLNIDSLENMMPLTMLVPNFYNNHKFTNLFEGKVGKGRILVCSIELDAIEEQYLEAAYMKEALYQYYNSGDFNPMEEIRMEQMRTIFEEKERGTMNRTNVARNKPAYADSEKSKSHSASHGNDNNPTTDWCASDAETGHYWYVDLQKEYAITGIHVVFAQEASYRYVIHVSSDQVNWNLAVNATGDVNATQERWNTFEDNARYVRITYSGLPNGVWASHKSFEVYVD